MYSALIWTGRFKPAFNIRITHLGKVTRTLVKPENCVHQSKLQGPANGPMENAAGFLIFFLHQAGEGATGVSDFPLAPPPPISTPGLTQMGWGRQVDPGVGSWGATWWTKGDRVSSTEILTEGRQRIPAQSLKLGETGFARSLADKRQLSKWLADIAWPGGYCEGH